MRGQYRMGLDVVEHWTLLGSVETVVERLDAYRSAGVQEILLMALGSDPLEQYEPLAEVRAQLAATGGAVGGVGSGGPQIAAREARR
jgi:alkanesulfonate monooxygenase SsuD/methylene tetrahydromethanopterin reductase-like flavin-dependent oxidoreductase (luciferase family)